MKVKLKPVQLRSMHVDKSDALSSIRKHGPVKTCAFLMSATIEARKAIENIKVDV